MFHQRYFSELRVTKRNVGLLSRRMLKRRATARRWREVIYVYSLEKMKSFRI